MLKLPRAVFLLSFVVIFVMSIMPMNVLVGGLAGNVLAPEPWMSTFAITAIIIGTALGTYPAAWLMSWVGRKNGLLIGIQFGIVTLLAAAISIKLQAFYLFCLSTFLMGFSVAIGQQMRFAAIELAGANKAPQAVSVMMLSGVFAAYLGPEIGSLANNQDLMTWCNDTLSVLPGFQSHPELTATEQNLRTIDYSIAYLGMAAVFILAFFLALVLIPASPNKNDTVTEQQSNSAPRNIFWLAVICSVTAFGVMSYVMTATPLSMHHHFYFSLEDAKKVIQWHILAMFLPSVVTGVIIAKIGNSLSILLGLGIFIVSLVIAMSGQSHFHFATSLIALGVAWNVLFTTGTTLLGEAQANKSQQASHDFFVFSTQALATLIAGATLMNFGWQGVLWGSAIAILPCLIWVANYKRNDAALDAPLGTQ